MCRQSETVCLIKSPAVDGAAGSSVVERLRVLPDPRRHRGVSHPFVAVLLVAASAAVAGRALVCGHRPVVRERSAAHTLSRLGAWALGWWGRGAACRSECRHDRAGYRPGLPRRPGRPDRRRSSRIGLGGRRRQGRPRLSAQQHARRPPAGRDDLRRPYRHPATGPRQDQRDHLLRRATGALRPNRGHRHRRALHTPRPLDLLGIA